MAQHHDLQLPELDRTQPEGDELQDALKDDVTERDERRLRPEGPGSTAILCSRARSVQPLYHGGAQRTELMTPQAAPFVEAALAHLGFTRRPASAGWLRKRVLVEPAA